MSGMVKVVYVVETRHRRPGTLKWGRWSDLLSTPVRGAAMNTRDGIASPQYLHGDKHPTEWQARVVPFDRRKR